MPDSPYKKFRIRYKNIQKEDSTRILKNRGQINFWNNLQKLFIKFSHEKLTVMFIPHNEAKMIHFHIPLIILLFFTILFILIISISIFSFQYQIKIQSQAHNLKEEVESTKKKLLFYKSSISNISRDMAKLKSSMIDSIIAITTDSNKANRIYNDNYSSLFFFQNNNFQDKDLNSIRQLHRDIYSTIFQTHGARIFLKNRSSIIEQTPSIWPVNGQITSVYGYRRDPLNFRIQFHSAIDIAAGKGRPVYSTAPGTVIKKITSKNYGKYMIIQHKYGFYSLYAHNSELLVNSGDRVSKGQVVAKVGRTGRTTGNHIHYEVHIGKKAVNPYLYLFRQ